MKSKFYTLRGGAWLTPLVRAAYRFWVVSIDRFGRLGFRVARNNQVKSLLYTLRGGSWFGGVGYFLRGGSWSSFIEYASAHARLRSWNNFRFVHIGFRVVRDSSRVLRGGSWLSALKNVRCACQGCQNPDDFFGDIGFRIAKNN